MSWLLTTLLLISLLSFNDLSEARNVKKLPSAVVVGTVYCDTCFQDDFSKSGHFISGAIVMVECRNGDSSKPRFKKQVKTDSNGEFKVHLPFEISKHAKRIEGCSVRLVSSSEPYCAVASRADSTSLLHLKSRKQGTHIFSAGFFTFKPLKQPNVCNQKPSVHDSRKLVVEKPSGFSDNKQLLPPLFPMPPALPNPFQPPPAPVLPNPLQPPPAPLIPNPFQPTPIPNLPNPFQPPPFPNLPNPFQPPPAPVIPNPFQPPAVPAPTFPFPQIPGLTPSPPPPAPSLFPPIPHFPPVPQFPLPPVPRVPGAPPRNLSP